MAAKSKRRKHSNRSRTIVEKSVISAPESELSPEPETKIEPAMTEPVLEIYEPICTEEIKKKPEEGDVDLTPWESYTHTYPIICMTNNGGRTVHQICSSQRAAWQAHGYVEVEK